MTDQQKACLWAMHLPSLNRDGTDLHLVKERIKDADGSERSNLKLIHNYKRPFWVTKEAARDHKQKRLLEHKENLDRYECTQASLARNAYRAIHGYIPKKVPYITEVARNPYVYGLDVTGAVLLKESYKRDFPDYMPRASVAMLDFETDVLGPTAHLKDNKKKVPISGAVTYKDRWIITASKSFLATLPAPADALNALADRYLEKWKIERNVKEVELIICENDFEVVKGCIDFLHETKPDFCAIWNMAFDINVMIGTCERYGVNPGKLFADPSIPPEFHHFHFREDLTVKRKANGDTMVKAYYDLWHTITCGASFYFIDAMCFYRLNRVMKGKKNSYALDAILDDELNMNKLRFEYAAEGLQKLDWHIEMQKNWKAEYMLYNVFDGLSMELLDEKTNDIGIALPSYVGSSELKSTNSNPKRLADNGFFFAMESRNMILMSTSDQMKTEMDEKLLGLDNWIITLPSELVKNTGRSIVYGVSNHDSRLSYHCGDIDVASSYPTTGTVCNVSYSTTRAEVYGIEGLNHMQVRSVAVNFTAAQTNCIELGRTLSELPSLDEAMEYF